MSNLSVSPTALQYGKHLAGVLTTARFKCFGTNGAKSLTTKLQSGSNSNAFADKSE